MNTFVIYYYYAGAHLKHEIKTGNMLMALGEFEYTMPYEKIYKIELKL